ncbi:hypothetical protein [Azospirillum canadense]|uniref:hypothetical protein n=1 Tax=Azospirillum canadense TaxID=403962 RepID=UPI0022275F81|nr:hypothetical protein [Azospirillum canadense]MCW2239919.1 type III secretion system FlhB-like substrate exporter [Azospirillum canadense]
MAPHPTSNGVADSLTAIARRRGVPVDDDTTILALLAALAPNPLVPHRMVLVAGSVLAGAFRHDRTLAEPDPDPAGHPAADRSF